MPVVFPSGLARSQRSARVVAIIPARYRSTRLPGKPLALIDGRTMVEHVWRRATLARRVDAVLVATDDDRVAAAVDGFGGVAVMTRADHATGTDRLAEVASELHGELIVNVQGDEPLIDPHAIDDVVAALDERRADLMATLRRRIDDPADFADPGVVKVVVDEQGYALYFSRAPIPFVRPGLIEAGPALREPQGTPSLSRGDGPACVRAWRHMGLYVYRREFLRDLAALAPTPLEQAEGLEQLRVLEHGFRIATVETTIDTVGVDTPEDLERVRRLVEAGARP